MTSSLRELKGMKINPNASMRMVLQLRFDWYEANNYIAKRAVNAGRNMQECMTPAMGGWKYTCECGTERILNKVCHNRSCPACNGKHNKEWMEFHRERLVDTRYLHMVFVLPEELNAKFLKNKEGMTDILFKVVYKILKKKYGKLTGGIIMMEHTEGSTLTLHPHIHCLIMLGMFDEKRKKFTEISGDQYVVSKIEKEFEEEYKKAYRKLEGIKKEQRDIFLDSLKGFTVWKKEKYKNSAEAVLGYFANGVRGGCISNDRILEVTEEIVKIAYKNKQTKNKWGTMDLEIDEFIKRVLLHIPGKNQKLVRMRGVFASPKRKVLEDCKEVVEGKKIRLKTRKEKKKQARETEPKIVVHCAICKKEMKITAEVPRIERKRVVHFGLKKVS